MTMCAISSMRLNLKMEVSEPRDVIRVPPGVRASRCHQGTTGCQSLAMSSGYHRMSEPRDVISVPPDVIRVPPDVRASRCHQGTTGCQSLVMSSGYHRMSEPRDVIRVPPDVTAS